MNMKFIARYWLACLLACCLLLRLLLNYFLLLYSAGRDGEGQPESNPLAKNVVSIAQNCSETQISFARGQPKTVAKREFHLPSGNPLDKNVVSIAQNCSETQSSFSADQPSRKKRGVDRPKL